jgi:hypothetical protein
LLVAAAAKAFRGGGGAIPVPTEIVVFLEVVVALILVFHRTAIAFRLLAAAFFAVLAWFAIGAVSRQESCDCLGEFSIWPGWLAGIDVLAALWLGAGALVLFRRRESGGTVLLPNSSDQAVC